MNCRQLRALAKRLVSQPTIEQLRRVGDVRYSSGHDGRFDRDTGMHAILVGHKVKTCNLMTWARWMEAVSRLRDGDLTERHVAVHRAGRLFVSTVFLGLDHNFGWQPPQWFETMAFIGGESIEMDRYETWEQAEAGHAAMVKRHTINAAPWHPTS